MAAYGEVAYGEVAYGEESGPSDEYGSNFTMTDTVLLAQTVANDFADTVTLTDIIADGNFWYYYVPEALTFTAALELAQGYAAKENIGLTENITHNVVGMTEVSERLSITDIELILFDATIAETVTFTEAQAYDNAIAAVEAIQFTTGYEMRLQAVAEIAEAIVLSSIGGVVDFVNSEDTVDLTTAVMANLMAYESHVANLLLTDEAVGTLNLRIEIGEEVDFLEDLSISQTLNVLIEEGIGINGALRLGTDVYAAWLVNPATTGTSRYENFPFNSFAEGTDGYYGAADDGIYRLQGTDDAGTNIDISIKTGLSDFGERRSKRIPDVFLGVMTSGQLVLKVTADEQGTRTEAWYNVIDHGDPDNHRAKVGKGLRGVYWGFELVNVDGADVDLDNLQLYPITLTRRV